ncbi:MAG: MauE/DoxX family redox-associated membrane protein [Steroidobacteraceae bacterium]
MTFANPYLDVWSVIASGVLCLVFVRALLHKLEGYAEFKATLGDYRLLPAALLPGAAAAVVGAESLAALLLIIPATREAGAMLGALLLGVYGLGIAVNLARGRNSIDCGCGGGGQGISLVHVLRNGLLMLLAVPVLTIEVRHPSGWLVSLATCGCVLVLWLMVVIFDQLLGNRSHAIATTYSGL